MATERPGCQGFDGLGEQPEASPCHSPLLGPPNTAAAVVTLSSTAGWQGPDWLPRRLGSVHNSLSPLGSMCLDQVMVNGKNITLPSCGQVAIIDTSTFTGGFPTIISNHLGRSSTIRCMPTQLWVSVTTVCSSTLHGDPTIGRFTQVSLVLWPQCLVTELFIFCCQSTSISRPSAFRGGALSSTPPRDLD